MMIFFKYEFEFNDCWVFGNCIIQRHNHNKTRVLLSNLELSLIFMNPWNQIWNEFFLWNIKAGIWDDNNTGPLGSPNLDQSCKIPWLSGEQWLSSQYVDGLVQERRNSIANTLELRLSCTNPSMNPCWGSQGRVDSLFGLMLALFLV